MPTTKTKATLFCEAEERLYDKNVNMQSNNKLTENKVAYERTVLPTFIKHNKLKYISISKLLKIPQRFLSM
jgi:hypothetical protein